MSAYSFKDITTDDLSFTSPEKLGNCYICNLYNDDDLVYVQTPILKISNINLSNDVEEGDDNYIEVSCDNKQFIDFLLEMDENCVESTFHTSKEWFKKDIPYEAIDNMYKERIIESDDNGVIYNTRFKIPVVNNKVQCNIYNKDKDIIDIKDIQLNNYIDYHDLNLIINDNYFFKNNNILNSLIDFNNKSYNKIIINKNVYLNELNNFCIINSNDLLNNTHLLINYYIIESSIIFNDHSILIENKININQKKNINIYNQIYKDFEKNNTFKISYPIYIFNNNKSLKEIKPSYFYKNIYLEDKYTFDNYLRSLKEINQYQYIIIIQMNKIKNFNNIHFEEIKEKLSNDLIPIYYKTKRKNCLNISDKFINIKNNEAFLCSKRLLTDYINHKLYPL